MQNELKFETGNYETGYKYTVEVSHDAGANWSYRWTKHLKTRQHPNLSKYDFCKIPLEVAKGVMNEWNLVGSVPAEENPGVRWRYSLVE